MKRIIEFLLKNSKAVLLWLRRILRFTQSTGALNSTDVDEKLLRIIDFLIKVHPELVKISEEFTRNVLATKFAEQPEVIVELIDAQPTDALTKLQELVTEQANAVTDLGFKTFPTEQIRQETYRQLEKELVSYGNRLGINKWHWVDKSK